MRARQPAERVVQVCRTVTPRSGPLGVRRLGVPLRDQLLRGARVVVGAASLLHPDLRPDALHRVDTPIRADANPVENRLLQPVNRNMPSGLSSNSNRCADPGCLDMSC